MNWFLLLLGLFLWTIGGLSVWRGVHILDYDLSGSNIVGTIVICFGLFVGLIGLWILHHEFLKINPELDRTVQSVSEWIRSKLNAA